MRKVKRITVASKPTYQGYIHAFKMAVIERIVNGQLSINQAAKEYDCSRGAVQKWVKKYANLERKLREFKGKSPQQEIVDLKKELTKAKRSNLIWEATMEVVEEMYGVNVKKKFMTEYQRRFIKEAKKK